MKRDETVLTSAEIESMSYYINKIKEINDEKYKLTGKKPLMFINTFGCQMNAHDSEKLEGMLLEMGYDKANEEKEADIIIYNTCCVRENAENKVYGNLGYLKKIKDEKKDLKIVVCGCMMQQDVVIDKIKKSYRHVDVIFGTFNLYRFPELLFTSTETKSLIIDVWKEHKEIIEDMPTSRKYPFKSSVNIMFGCNNFCTYCIVPYVRGRERSREVQDILDEITDLANDGVKEVMLLGQNVNSYGKTLENKITFAELLKLITKIEGIERIRFMTSHPKDLSDDLIYAIRDEEKICNYIHLPFQSGSTSLLKKMNRGYSKEHYLDLLNKIKKEIPNVGLSTDIIVGFPGETEEDFLDTLDIVKEVRFNNSFTYFYSKREGTPAAIMENQVDEAVAKDRFNRLLEVINGISLENSKKQVGKIVKVLVESISEDGENTLTGRADDNALVHFEGDEELIGEIVNVEIIDCKSFYLKGVKKDGNRI